MLPQELPSLDALGLAPELKTAIRRLYMTVYAVRDSVPLFVDMETPQGPLDGTNTRFRLAFPPNPPTSLLLFFSFHASDGGVLLLQGRDYTVTGQDLVYTTALGGDWHRA